MINMSKDYTYNLSPSEYGFYQTLSTVCQYHRTQYTRIMRQHFCTEIQHSGVGGHFVSTRKRGASVTGECVEEQSTNMSQLLNSH